MSGTVTDRLIGSRGDEARRIALAFVASAVLLLAALAAGWQATHSGTGAGTTLEAAAGQGAVTAAGYFQRPPGNRIPVQPA